MRSKQDCSFVVIYDFEKMRIKESSPVVSIVGVEVAELLPVAERPEA